LDANKSGNSVTKCPSYGTAIWKKRNLIAEEIERRKKKHTKRLTVEITNKGKSLPTES